MPELKLRKALASRARPSRSADGRHALQQAIDLLLGVVVYGSDSYHAAGALQTQTLGQAQGVVVAVPDVDLRLGQAGGNLIRMMSFEGKGDGGHPLVAPRGGGSASD